MTMDDPWPTIETQNDRMKYISKDELKEFYDNAIRSWRVQRDNAANEKAREMCVYYIDSIQSMRMSIFGSILGEPKLNDREHEAVRRVVEAFDEELGVGVLRKEDIDVLRELLLED